MRLRIDGFLAGMVAAVALAWLVPGPGAAGGSLHPELLTKLGVALIFFLHGVALSFSALKAGTLRWPLHLVVQASTFLLFPLLGFVFLAATGRWLDPDLRLGVFYLCVLPSTVSSSVAMTAAARGNVPAAVFNATLSSLIGVFLTPLWIRAMVSGATQSVPLVKVMLDLVLWLVLPLVVGQLIRPWLGAWASRNKKTINLVDRGTILLLVYTSFCDSMKTGVWSSHGFAPLAITMLGTLALFGIVMILVKNVSDALHFSTEDKIAAMFCGSKKTLASGVPMAHLIFGTSSRLSLILLPIMIYHPLQLIICGFLAGRWAKRVDRTSPTSPPSP